jgi:hypothetical protein
VSAQAAAPATTTAMPAAPAPAPAGDGELLDTPLYQGDPLVRRAAALQRTRVARAGRGGA